MRSLFFNEIIYWWPVKKLYWEKAVEIDDDNRMEAIRK